MATVNENEKKSFWSRFKKEAQKDVDAAISWRPHTWAKEKPGSKILGLDAIKDSVQTTNQMVAEHHERVLKFISNAVRGPNIPSPVFPEDCKDPGERFKVAAAFYGVRNKTALTGLENTLRFRAGVFGVLTMVALALTIINASTIADPLQLVSSTAACGSITFLFFALAARKCFEHWQVRTRRLGSVFEWLRQPAEWWPMSLDGVGGKAVALLIVAAAAGAALLPDAALAAFPSFEAPAVDPSHDLGGKVLDGLLPTTGGNPFTYAMGVFVNWLMFLGVLMMCWHTIVGTINTAHEGQVLGTKWHQVWAPVRVVLGVALLAPAFSSGLTMGHYQSGGIAVLGSTMGGQVWQMFVTSTLQGGPEKTISVPALGLPSGAGGLAVTQAILEREVCREIIARHHAMVTGVLVHTAEPTKRYAWGGRIVPAEPPAEGVFSDKDKRVEWSYGRCGGLSISKPESLDMSEKKFVEQRAAAISNVIARVRQTGLATQIARASLPNSDEDNPAIYPTNVAEQMRSIGKLYDTDMTAAANTFANSKYSVVRQKQVDFANKCGWWCAGMFYRPLMEANNQVSSLKAEQPEWWNQDLPVQMGQRDTGPMIAGKAVQELKQLWIEDAKVERMGVTLASAGDSNSNPLVAILAPITKNVVEYIVYMAGTDNKEDPGQDIQAFGHMMIDTSLVGFGAGVAAAWAANTTPADVLGADGGWNYWIAPVALMLLFGALSIGITCAYILPMTPYIAWMYNILGHLVMLVESMVAIPIWAFCLIRMDDQELFGQVQKPGIIIMFNFLLRPVLMVFGLIGFFLVNPVIINFLNLTFAPAFVGSQGGQVTAVTAAIVGVCMLTYLQYQLIVRSANMLITKLPDRIARWFGAAAEGLEEGHNTERDNTTIIGAVQGVSRQGSGALQPKLKRPSGPKSPKA